MQLKKTAIAFVLAAVTLLTFAGCKKDSDFLEIDPTSLIPDQSAFTDAATIVSILADLYDRMVEPVDLNSGNDLGDWRNFADFGESFPSENNASSIVQKNNWDYGTWSIWDYGYVRDLNLFLERMTASTSINITAADKKRFLAEGRFLRASYYFEMVKRMGGVPLILQSLTYTPGQDLSTLQFPRAKESAVYDFIISEGEAIKNDLPNNATTKDRATQGTVLAMITRAALYAGSIAKYGVGTPAVALPNGEVGINASLANGYYTKALATAQQLINGTAGSYGLYLKRPDDLAANFSQLFVDKAANPETIFIKDYKLRSGKVNGFTVQNQPRFGSEEEGEAGRINPSLNLVQTFEKLDNSFAPIPITDGSGNPVYYTSQADAFAGRDARLSGTIILPGTSFKNPTDIFAGLLLSDGSILTGDQRGQTKIPPGGTEPVQVVGQDGPINGVEFATQTGFYIRKYLDPIAGSGGRGTQSEVPYVRYRYAEVLLNAAEAAFELSQPDVAAGYINQVRRRAGFTTDLTAAQISFARIVHERRVELAFEGHFLFDMKRWRLATSVWDGQPMSPANLVADIGSPTKRNTQPYGLWPYKIYNPGNPNHGKWIFRIVLPGLATGAPAFRLGNYYSRIAEDILAANPKLVRQPNQ